MYLFKIITLKEECVSEVELQQCSNDVYGHRCPVVQFYVLLQLVQYTLHQVPSNGTTCGKYKNLGSITFSTDLMRPC